MAKAILGLSSRASCLSDIQALALTEYLIGYPLLLFVFAVAVGSPLRWIKVRGSGMGINVAALHWVVGWLYTDWSLQDVQYLLGLAIFVYTVYSRRHLLGAGIIRMVAPAGQLKFLGLY